MQPAITRSVRHIERDSREYSLSELLLELRTEARSYWGCMHEFRRLAITTGPLDSDTYRRLEMETRNRLAATLRVLNAGLGREGSYHATYWRRVDRELAAAREREAVA